jgi:hypothetical protein
MALRLEPGNTFGDILDALGISDRRRRIFEQSTPWIHPVKRWKHEKRGGI